MVKKTDTWWLLLKVITIRAKLYCLHNVSTVQTQLSVFNRFACFWPKGYQLGSLGKSHQNGDYLKQAIRKVVFQQESNLQESSGIFRIFPQESKLQPLESNLQESSGIFRIFPQESNLQPFDYRTCSLWITASCWV